MGRAFRLPRSLGLRDLVLLGVVAIVNFGLVPTVAVYGATTLALWVLAFLVFFLPSTVAVLRLARLHPGEGGLYLWARRQFGEWHGFVSGWCYWVNNLFYIPMQLIYLAGVAAFASADPEGLGNDPRFVGALAGLWLVVATGANLSGMRRGKWIQNLGAVCLLLLGGGIVVAALLALRGTTGESGRMAAAILAETSLDWSLLPAFSVMCFAFIGIELAPTMGSEIVAPERTLPRAALITGALALGGYLLVTLALLVLVPRGEMGVVQGLLQAVGRGAEQSGLDWIVAPLAVVTALAIAGSAAAWFAGSARVPFVLGLDRTLPPALGRVHPRWGSPHVALVTSAAVSALLVVVALAGSTVAEAYQKLLASTVIVQLVPFLYLFAGLIRLDGTAGGRRWSDRLLGTVGLLATVLGIGVAFLPPAEVERALSFQLQVLAGVALTLGIGLVFLVRSRRQRGAELSTSAAAAGEVAR